ncbi:MAG: transcriptional regulator FnrL [Limimaricola soesokkakensis]|uniref:transcriptional regulator FnrL n=1 Tax=Limimaricola soesokkakensis TaxID=1343159 RepID=UPI004059C671
MSLYGNPRCSDCGIRSRAVCARCDEVELQILEAAKFYRRYEAGRRIAWAGDEMNFVGSVVSGIATISQSMDDGRVQMVGLLLPSDFIGHPGRAITPYTIIAASNVTLCCFRRLQFERLIKDMPHISGRLLEMKFDELEAARQWMIVLGRKTARERVASLLFSVARREISFSLMPATRNVRIDLPLTREAMSEYLGLTLETVSRQINRLGREGIIALDKKRRIIIPDLARLNAETGGNLVSA